MIIPTYEISLIYLDDFGQKNTKTYLNAELLNYELIF